MSGYIFPSKYYFTKQAKNALISTDSVYFNPRNNGTDKSNYNLYGMAGKIDTTAIDVITVQDLINYRGRESDFKLNSQHKYILKKITVSKEGFDIYLVDVNGKADKPLSLKISDITRFRDKSTLTSDKYDYDFIFSPSKGSALKNGNEYIVDSFPAVIGSAAGDSNALISKNAVLVGISRKKIDKNEFGTKKDVLYDIGLLPVKFSNKDSSKGAITYLADEYGSEISTNDIGCIEEINYSSGKILFGNGDRILTITYYPKQLLKDIRYWDYPASLDAILQNNPDIADKGIDTSKKICYVVANENIKIEKKIENLKEVVNFLEVKAEGSNTKYAFNDQKQDIFSKVVFASVKGVTSSEINSERFQVINDFIDKYTAERQKKAENKIEPMIELDEEHFYNHISGATPEITVSFKQLNNTWEEINTVEFPFIKSLTVEDTGVKRVKLVLWDKDFGSYYNKNKSLETIIRDCIYSVNVKQEKINSKGETIDDNNSNDNTTKKEIDFKETEYFSFVRMKGTEDMTNLKVHIKFQDYNHEWNNVPNDYKTEFGLNGLTKRTHRTWDIKSTVKSNVTYSMFNMYEGTNGDFGCKVPSYKKGEKKANVELSMGDTFNASEDDYIDRYTQVITTPESTTSGMRIMNLMIVGLKTKLMDYGIEYEIDAIESKCEKSMNYSIVQRYEDIKGTPKEVLYTLMRLFNENQSGFMMNSPIRVFWADEHDIVEELDSDYYNQQNGRIIMPKTADDGTVNKKICLSLGGQNAYNNYRESSDMENRILSYKSIKQLLDEFCAACPPLIESENENFEYLDNYGNTQTLENSGGNITRPLCWEAHNVKFGDKQDEVTCVFFYYRKTLRPKTIRKYKWGPGNAGNTVIKNLNIENANEFAVLTARSTFDIDENKQKSYTKIEDRKEVQDRYTGEVSIEVETKSNLKLDSLGLFVNRVTGGPAKNALQVAYSNCMYKGTIDIMGDPFYSFDEMMVPCTYPIKLDINVPVSEYERGSKNYSDVYFGGSNSVASGYRKHYLSGYYIITKITHNISISGYTTTLDVMSFPSINTQLGITSAEQLRQQVEEELKKRPKPKS